MAPYRPDPGQVFASDVHRRVLAALPSPEDTPVALQYAAEPILADENIPFHVPDAETYVDIQRVVEELVADGFASFDQDTRLVQRTAGGTNELAAPLPDPPELTPEEVEERETENAEKALRDHVRQLEGRLASNRATLEELTGLIADDEADLATAQESL